jgi:hypothetical protein
MVKPSSMGAKMHTLRTQACRRLRPSLRSLPTASETQHIQVNNSGYACPFADSETPAAITCSTCIPGSVGFPSWHGHGLAVIIELLFHVSAHDTGERSV